MEEEDANRRHKKVSGHLPIRGMESVIATVSGYHGTERFNLIKLIDKSGASYVGSMNPSTTHLVCWRFEGKKYELAKKFKMSIINHRWIEDCIKEGRRLPEAPYTSQCGQEVGPIMLDISESKQLNHSKEPVILIESEEDFNSWTDSTLLKENLSPELVKHKDRPRRKSNDSILNEDHPSSIIYCSGEHSLQGSRRTEIEELNFPSSAFLKPKKKRSSDFAETSRRSRRLVKNISGDLVEIISGSEKESLQLQARDHETLAQSYNLDVEMPEISMINKHGSGFSCHQSEAEPSRIGVDGTGETEVNRLLDNGNQCLHAEGISSNLTGNGQEPRLAVDEVQNETDNTCKLSTSTALSCVICWTDFSSSRGVLPCGHRFCFSCIQTWANHMASSRKASTCPLCKASFVAITKVEHAIPADQKIYSQTIPNNNPEMNIYILPEVETSRFCSNPSRTPVCCRCSCREPADLLVKCHLCETLCIHSYCLDPPLLPWTCMHCKDLQRLYRRSW